MGELMPCPFCGHAAKTATILTTTVCCSHCKARGPLMPTGEHTFETARDHDTVTAWNTRPRTEGRGEGEKLFPLLASAWFYGDWKAETHNERQMQVVMERAGWWPITSEAELLGKLDASPIREPEISKLTKEAIIDAIRENVSADIHFDLCRVEEAADAILNLAPVGGRGDV